MLVIVYTLLKNIHQLSLYDLYTLHSEEPLFPETLQSQVGVAGHAVISWRSDVQVLELRIVGVDRIPLYTDVSWYPKK